MIFLILNLPIGQPETKVVKRHPNKSLVVSVFGRFPNNKKNIFNLTKEMKKEECLWINI